MYVVISLRSEMSRQTRENQVFYMISLDELEIKYFLESVRGSWVGGEAGHLEGIRSYPVIILRHVLMKGFREETFSQHPHLRLILIILIAEVALVAHVFLFSEFGSARPLNEKH